MAAAGGKAGPSLSYLQAALRRGTPGSAGRRDSTSLPPQEEEEIPEPPPKRAHSLDRDSGPPPKKRAVPPPPAGSRQPGEQPKAPGLMAKVLSPAGEGPTVVTKAVVAKRSMAAPGPITPRGGAAAAAPDAERGVLAISELMSALEEAAAGAKLRHVVKLAEALGKSLPIDHLNHFLRVLKKKILERAQADGVRVQAVKVPAGGRPPAQQSSPAATPAAASVATPAADLQGGAPPPPRSQPLQPPPQPEQPAAVGKQPGALLKQPGAQPKQPKPMAVKGAVTKSQQPAGAMVKQQSKRASVSKQAPVAKTTPVPTPPAPPPADPQGNHLPPPRPVSVEDDTEDPLYAMVSELSEDPVVRDGELVESRFGDVLKRLWGGVAKKSRDWVAIWQAMCIPVDKQSEALQRFLNMAFVQTAETDRAPQIIAELIKSHKVKMRAMEEVLVAFGGNLDGIMAVNEDAWHVYAKFFLHTYPKAQRAGWGWSRVGWSWTYWWQFVEKCTQTLEPARAFDVLTLMLRLIQEKEGQAIGEIEEWKKDGRMDRVIAKLGELGQSDASSVVSMLKMNGVTIEA